VEYCIGSAHTSIYWYEYQIYANLIEEINELGFTYKQKSHNRIYFLGWPLRNNYKDIGEFDKKHNNICLSFSHAQIAKNLNDFDKIFVSSYGMQNFILSKSKIKCEVLKPFSSLKKTDKIKSNYQCDIAFIGNIRKRQIVEDVLPLINTLNLEFKIFGYDWKSYQGNKQAIKYWQGDVISYKDIPILANSAKIILIDHHSSMNEIQCVSHKYVDLLASNSFVISDFNRDVYNYKGIIYKNKKELYTLIKKYLYDDKSRQDHKTKQNNIVIENTTKNAAKRIVKEFK